MTWINGRARGQRNDLEDCKSWSVGNESARTPSQGALDIEVIDRFCDSGCIR
jgi:hypothetical protein